MGLLEEFFIVLKLISEVVFEDFVIEYQHDVRPELFDSVNQALEHVDLQCVVCLWLEPIDNHATRVHLREDGAHSARVLMSSLCSVGPLVEGLIGLIVEQALDLELVEVRLSALEASLGQLLDLGIVEVWRNYKILLLPASSMEVVD